MSCNPAPSPSRHIVLHDIVRKLPDGSEIELKRDQEKERLTFTSGRLTFRPADAGRRRFPRSVAAANSPTPFEIAGARFEAPDRQNALRHFDRRNALLPERYLSPHRATSGTKPMLRAVATDGHRLAQMEMAAARRRRRHAGRHRAAQNGPRIAAPAGSRRAASDGLCIARQGALRNWQRHADLEVDRRHLPRLWPRHPARQRQDAQGPERRIHQRRRPRLDHRLERGRAVKLAINGTEADALGQQPRWRQRHRRSGR